MRALLSFLLGLVVGALGTVVHRGLVPWGLLAALGLVPAAFSKAMGAETQRPIAVVIVGSTISAALLTLLVLPTMYRLLVGILSRHAPRLIAAPAPQHERRADPSLAAE